MHTRSWQFKIEPSNGIRGIVPAFLDCELRDWDVGRFRRVECQITARYKEHELCECASDAFCQIRQQLASTGFIPLCYGASRNVFPSGMARDMGSGLQAYELQMGVPAVPAQIVSIFDTGPDIDPVSVEAQREFFDAYLRTPKRTT